MNRVYTYQFPPSFWYLLDVLYGFLKGTVGDRDFRYPHGAKQMRPFHARGLFECSVYIRTEYAALRSLAWGP